MLRKLEIVHDNQAVNNFLSAQTVACGESEILSFSKNFMSTIRKFEEINAWKSAIELTEMLYEVTERLPFSRDFSLKDQMKRSALSVSSNIAEGFERESNASFIYYLKIAKASAGEFRSQLYVAKARNYITQAEFTSLYNKAETTSKLIAGFITYLRPLNKLKETKKKQKAVVV